MSARSAVALQRGADEQMLDAVDHYRDSDLSPAQQAALALADAYLTSPADMPIAVKDEVASQLTAVQAIEIVLKLMGFSSDKAMVALGIDFDEERPFTM